MSNRLFRKILLGIFAVGSLMAYAQQDSIRFRILYEVNIPVIDKTYVDNDSLVKDIRSYLEEMSADSMRRITGVKFRGTASPEGPYEFNRWLSNERLKNFKALVDSYIDVPYTFSSTGETDIAWREFRDKVEASDLEYRDEVLEVIDEGEYLIPWYNDRHIDARLVKLRRMHSGKVWASLLDPILRDLRYGEAIFEYTYMGVEKLASVEPKPVTIITETAVSAPQIEPIKPVNTYNWTPRIYVKTNLAAWALLVSNAAVEFDLGKHWSFNLPVYYSCWDYFKSTIKFRTFAIEPEVRYWFSPYSNDGWFIGAHFGLAYYNLAFNGDHRYQDYRGKTPALGGGIAFGYRLPFGHDKRWRAEFSIGAGVYPLDYSVFQNTPDVKDGIWLYRNQKTLFGIDQIGVTIGYAFDLNKYTRTYIQKGGVK